MVTCTVSGTCHHEVNWVRRINSFDQDSFQEKNITSSNTSTICFGSFLKRSFFCKICRLVKCPSEEHITT